MSAVSHRKGALARASRPDCVGAGHAPPLHPLEVQNFGGVTADDNTIATPHPDIRVTNGVVS